MLSGIPTFSATGFVHEPKLMLDKILVYYEALNYTGSLLYKGKLYSLSRAIFDTSGDINLLTDRVKSDITSLLSTNFPDGVDVTVTSEQIDSSDMYNIIVSARVQRDGRAYDLAGAINSVPSTWVAYTKAKKLYTRS